MYIVRAPVSLPSSFSLSPSLSLSLSHPISFSLDKVARNPRRGHSDLSSFVEWLWEQCADRHRPPRRYESAKFLDR